MAGGMTRRNGPTLAERVGASSPRRGDDARHCWVVDAPGHPGRWPGLLLSAEHLRRHGWTPQLYRSTFGLNRSTALCSPAVAVRRRAIGIDRYQRNAAVRNGLAHGQELARSGQLLAMSHAVQRPGTASLERRRRSGEVTAVSRSARRAGAADRRRKRIAELGFESERDYLIDRYVLREWPVARIKTELEIGSSVLSEILDEAGIKRRRPGGAGPAFARWGRPSGESPR